MLNGVHTFWIMPCWVLDYISFAWVVHIFLVVGYYIFTPLFFKLLNLSESFPILMLLPLTGFTEYSEAVSSIDSHWVLHSCSKVMGFFLRWQNMVFIFKVQTWNFVCGIKRSFAFTMENILSVWYTATPGWTSKFGKVWKTRCQNAATRANIWRCFLVSWDDKYLWVMVSNNRHELYFVANYYAFPVYIIFLAKYGI